MILGLTFKENCSDIRNSKVVDIINDLKEYGIESIVVDPWASPSDAMLEYGVELTAIEDVADVDCVIVAVAHEEFKAMGVAGINGLFKDGQDVAKVLIDVKGLYDTNALTDAGIQWWRL